MTTTQQAERVRPTTTEVSETKSDSWSTPPNGGPRCHDFYTTVTSREVWTEGQYAGHSYRITQVYISSDPAHRGQLISSSSRPW